MDAVQAGHGSSVTPPETVNKTIPPLSTAMYGDFLSAEFDSRAYAERSIETTAISATLGRLKDGLDALERDMASVLGSHQDDLLRHASNLGPVEALIASVRSGHASLQSSLAKLRDRVKEPTARMEEMLLAAERLHAVTDIFRHLLRFLQLMRSVRGYLQSDAVDLAKAAACLSELGALLENKSLTGIEIVDAERSAIAEYLTQVKSLADARLKSGLAGATSVADVSVALESFHQLHILDDKLNEEMTNMTRTIDGQVKQSFDTRVLANDAREIAAKSPSTSTGPGGPRRVGEPTTTVSSAAWASAFWARYESCLEVVAVHSSRASALEQSLVRLSISSSPAALTTGKLWSAVAAAFSREVATAAKSPTSFLYNMFVSEFPKMKRLAQQLVVARVGAAAAAEAAAAAVTGAFAPLEAQFLAKSLAKMFDPVNAMFAMATGTSGPSGAAGGAGVVAGGAATTGKVPTVQEATQLASILDREIAAVRFDAALERGIARNAAKTLQLFCVRCEGSAVATIDSFIAHLSSSSSSASSALQLAAAHTLFVAVWTHIDGSATELWSPAACDVISSALNDLGTLVAQTAESLVAAAGEYILDGAASSMTATEQQMWTDIASRAQRVHVAFVSVLGGLPASQQGDAAQWAGALATSVRCGIAWRASLIRVDDDAARKRLAANVETAATATDRSLLLTSEGNAQALHARKAIVAVLTAATAEDAATAAEASTGDVMSETLWAVHHIMSRSEGAMALPHMRSGMAEGAYATWARSHIPSEVRTVLVKSLKDYAADANKRGAKEYAKEYPVAVKMLGEH